MIFFAYATEGLACSVSVNNTFQKNELIAKAASHLGISLDVVSAITISNYEKEFTGSVGPSSCPEYLEIGGRVNFKYSQGKKSCSAIVEVHIKQYMGEEIPTGPMEEVSFTNESSKCLVLRRIQI